MKKYQIDYIVGIPSGQLIYVDQHEITTLMNLGYTDWDPDIMEFIFDDRVIGGIESFLKRIQIGDDVISVYGTSGTVESIAIYDGRREVWGIDVSDKFDPGKKLYLVNDNGKKSIYSAEQLKKVRKAESFQ